MFRVYAVITGANITNSGSDVVVLVERKTVESGCSRGSPDAECGQTCEHQQADNGAHRQYRYRYRDRAQHLGPGRSDDDTISAGVALLNVGPCAVSPLGSQPLPTGVRF